MCRATQKRQVPRFLPAPQVSDEARYWVHTWKNKEKKTTKTSLPKKVNPGRLAALWIEKICYCVLWDSNGSGSIML